MKKVIFTCGTSLIDNVLLTAAVRDLHKTYPNQFLTDVRTAIPDFWLMNPYVTRLSEDEERVQIVSCELAKIRARKQAPFHVTDDFRNLLNEALGIQIHPSEQKGFIPLSESEKIWDSQIFEIIGKEIPFWLIIVGGKPDVTVRWWGEHHFQEVVDHFCGKLQFVQVGAKEDYHPALKGVIDLRGKTTVRELVRLVYHSQGIICPVSIFMHLAAAIETKSHRLKSRPTVVIAGGRESAIRITYSQQQLIHTNGALFCCDSGGCLKDLLPGCQEDAHKDPGVFCVNTVEKRPHCMAIITVSDVVRRIELYFNGTDFKYLTTSEAHLALEAISTCSTFDWNPEGLKAHIFQKAVRAFLQANKGSTHKIGKERGIVICAVELSDFVGAWVCFRLMKHLKCPLPMQMWHLPQSGIGCEISSLIAGIGVDCINAKVYFEGMNGSISRAEVEPYALLHSSFKEALLVAPDVVPVRDPNYLFDTPEFKEKGLIVWSTGKISSSHRSWDLFGLSYREEPQLEPEVVCMDTERCCQALLLAKWCSENCERCRDYGLRDQDWMQMTLLTCKLGFAIPSRWTELHDGITHFYDFGGERLFQRRFENKWSFRGHNVRLNDFLFENECLSVLDELYGKVSLGLKSPPEPKTYCEGQNKTGSTPESRVRFVVRAPFDTFTGYGQHARQVVDGLRRSGRQIGIIPLTERSSAIETTSAEVIESFGQHFPACSWELLIHPASLPTKHDISTIYFTMWETTRLPEPYLLNLQRAAAVVVPCAWNASSFNAQGLSVPLFVCPLGIDPSVFAYRAPPNGEICVFGAAGNCSISSHSRKGIGDVMKAFGIAFPNERDVRLRIKAQPNDQLPETRDTRIEIICTKLALNELVDWYSSLTCFVSASRAEAWGFMHHQAMAIGRPVIASRFGGLEEFFDEHVGFCVDYELEPAGGRYRGFGLWARPSLASLATQMRHVYDNREEACEKGVSSSERAHRYSWDHANHQLNQILSQMRCFA